MKTITICISAVALAVVGKFAYADFVINDDLIVDGSACVGFDCVSGESFGFDTLRLKENNLRIKFDDTSVAASYPRNDWQLTANDSANGGASKFSIDDISGNRTPFTVEANARSHSLYVDDGGRVGSRTSTPSVEFHTIDGDTPTLRLQQDGSSGFAPQTWDVAGNETNFFVRDVTNGSQLPFRIRPDAPSSSIFIDTDGSVGLGTSSPDHAFELERSGEAAFLAVTRSDSGGITGYLSAAANAVNVGAKTNHQVNIVSDFTVQMTVDSAGVITMADGGGYDGTWNPASSREIKDNIRPLDVHEAIQALDGLEPVRYVYKSSREEGRIGFIAEDVPALVARNDRKSLSTMDIVAVLTRIVQQQQQTIAGLESHVHDQNKAITAIESRMAMLQRSE